MEPDSIKELIENKIVFIQRMGLKVMELRPGYVKLQAPLKGNENHFGSMYAGALFTLAEIPGGALAISTFDFSKYSVPSSFVENKFRYALLRVMPEKYFHESKRKAILSACQRNEYPVPTTRCR